MLSFFSSIWNWIKVIKGLIATIQFLIGKIEEAKFLSQMKKIKEGTDKAQQGELDDRLEGGQSVEDNFNRHT